MHICIHCLQHTAPTAGPLTSILVSLLQLVSFMLEDSPVEIKQQLKQSKLLQAFAELAIRGRVLTRNKVCWSVVVVDRGVSRVLEEGSLQEMLVCSGSR